MRWLKYIVIGVFFLNAELIAGCAEEKKSEEIKPDTTLEDVKEETSEVIEATKAFTLQQKKEYQQHVENKLTEYNQKIDKIKIKTEQLKDEANTEFQQEMSELQKQIAEATDKLNELGKESEKAWTDLKTGLDLAMRDLDKAIKKASERFQ